MPKVLDSWLAKLIFLEIGLQFVLTKLIKDLLQMGFMLFCIVAINEYIIKVDQNKIISNVCNQTLLHS